MSLKYEPSLELLLITAKPLFALPGHTVEYVPFTKCQLTLRNQVHDLTWCKFDHVTLKRLRQRTTQGPSWGYSKVNFHQVCQLSTTISHKMAPRMGQSGAGITPRGTFCGPSNSTVWNVITVSLGRTGDDPEGVS